MASIVPTRFEAKIAGGGAQVAVGKVIDKADEIKDHVERSNFLYAVAGRRVLAERVFAPGITSTSSSFVSFPNWFARLADTRYEIGVTTFADDAVLELGIYNASTGLIIGTATTHTHPAGGASVASTTITLPTASVVEEILVLFKVKRNVTSATVYSVRALELSLGASDLPT